MDSDYRFEFHRVTWVREPDDRTLWELCARPWLLCLASTYEGFGQPCVEVTGRGTPPVAARNREIGLVSGRRRSAALVEDDRLRVTLAQLVSDEARREQLAALGLRRAHDFGWERACGAYESAFAAARGGRAGVVEDGAPGWRPGGRAIARGPGAVTA